MVKIPTRKFPGLGPLVHSSRALPVLAPAAAAVRAAVSAERDNSKLAVRQPERTKRMKIQKPDAKEKLVLRLRRIEGQVRGVQSMLDDERDCREIMQQLAAIHSAVQGVSRIFLQEYATTCLTELDESNPQNPGADLRVKREKIVQDMITLLDKAP
jgi:DNA-binding FrmR family transcriptional regulator